VNDRPTVEPVVDKPGRRRFVELPKRLYAGQPGYVAPLDMERMEAIDPARNPYFQHAEVALFLARRGDETVGRISAQVCQLTQKKTGERIGHFGYLDAIDDQSVFRALFDAAENWLKARGMDRALGPFSFSSNEECGQLVSGFDQPAMLMMPYHRPYQDHRVGAEGYRNAKDLLAYIVDETTYRAVGTNRILDKLRQDQRIRLRSIDIGNMRRDLELVLEIFNDAWAENWGMVPFTSAEIEAAAKAMKPLIDPDLVVIAEFDGEPAGMLVCLPNLWAAADLNGRLLPFGWLKLLWRLKRKTLHGGA
jgi:hypothetical protein